MAKGKKGKKNEKKDKKQAKPQEKEEKESKVKKIIRIAATDLNGDLSVERAVREVKGIGFSMSKSIVKTLGLKGKKLSDLSDKEKERLEATIKEPEKAGLPKWALNREGKHLVSAELDLKVKQDVDFMKMIKSYKGVRHSRDLPVRGQRTRGSFRKGAKVGVSKKKQLIAAKKKKEGDK